MPVAVPFAAHPTIPGLPPEASRSVTHQFKRVEAELIELNKLQEITPLISADYLATVNQLIRINIPAAGMRILLPPASDANHGKLVSMAVEGSSGSLTVNVVGGVQLINGVASVTITSPGLYEAKAIHEGGWVVTPISSGGGGESLAATLVIGAATGGTDMDFTGGSELQMAGDPGVAGEVLTSGGPGVSPTWAPAGGGGTDPRIFAWWGV